MASTQGARSRKRTSSQAIAQDKYDIAGIQTAKGRRTKQFQKEVGSYKGATRMAIGQVQRQNLGGLRGTPEGNQLQKEYTGRIRDLRKSLPFTLAPVQREYKSDIQGLESDLGAAQLDLQQDRQDKLAAISDIIAAQKETKAEAAKDVAENQTEKKAGVDTAYRKALRMIKEQDLVNKGELEGDKRDSALPKSEADWFQFLDALEGKEGVDERSARKAVAALQRRLGADKSKGEGPIETFGARLGSALQGPPPKRFRRRFPMPLG